MAGVGLGPKEGRDTVLARRSAAVCTTMRATEAQGPFVDVFDPKDPPFTWDCDGRRCRHYAAFTHFAKRV
ncbi:unnamed protein product [Vitrella brassicaformis CCMP3155]|uniref:Uncharacterized protein n=1 Tax=Vitrella brassicaformis (strain CCMP3155) TaxID=1169540 RepID=A0A0G4EQ76_VITBC|nr:unnamed protein product [Vitrella brassicaformis CCMP3155]|eukprot:CEL99764.1 unnamed protein product [Vitrella brassicaformis CCMP3155]